MDCLLHNIPAVNAGVFTEQLANLLFHGRQLLRRFLVKRLFHIPIKNDHLRNQSTACHLHIPVFSQLIKVCLFACLGTPGANQP